MKKFVGAAGIFGIASLLASCGGSASGPNADPCISATFCATASLTFTPSSANRAVQAGIVWANNSSVLHNVTFDNPAVAASAGLTGGDIKAGDLIVQTATKAGTYPFHCNVHAGMTGTITIQ